MSNENDISRNAGELDRNVNGARIEWIKQDRQANRRTYQEATTAQPLDRGLSRTGGACGVCAGMAVKTAADEQRGKQDGDTPMHDSV